MRARRTPILNSLDLNFPPPRLPTLSRPPPAAALAALKPGPLSPLPSPQQPLPLQVRSMLHQSTFSAFAVLALALAAAPALAQECDCTRPLSLAGPPVCGANRITFQTRCLAICQGVAIAAPGPCGAGKHCQQLAL